MAVVSVAQKEQVQPRNPLFLPKQPFFALFIIPTKFVHKLVLVSSFAVTPSLAQTLSLLLRRRKMTGPPAIESVTLDLLKKKMQEFAKERNWEQFHSPRNLLLALVGEVGELSEIFQWKGEVPKGLPDWKEEEKVHLGEELSDVLLYLVQLSDICGIDLGKAALRKVELNAIKYPASSQNNTTNTNNNSTESG